MSKPMHGMHDEIRNFKGRIVYTLRHKKAFDGNVNSLFANCYLAKERFYRFVVSWVAFKY